MIRTGGRARPVRSGIDGSPGAWSNAGMSTESRLRGFRRILFYLLCLSVAAVFSLYFARLRMYRLEYGNATLEMIVNGTAPPTFQYRVLLPWLIGFLKEHSLEPSFVSTLHGYEFGSELVFTFLLLVTFWHLLGCVLRDPFAKAAGVLVFGHVLFLTYVAPVHFPFYYIYDLPAVFFFCLGLLLMRKEKWVVYYPLFFIATLNRQTTCFLTVIFFLTGLGKRRLAGLAGHVLCQSLIWAGLTFALGWVYRHNTTELSAGRLPGNLGVLLSFDYFPVVLSSVGYVWIPALAGWRLIRDDFSRRACLVLPFFLVGAWLTGNLQEIRIYGELIPVFVPAFLLVLATALGRNAAPAPGPHPQEE